MNRFKVFRLPARGFEAVKIGFSWPAFCFGIFWMLAKRLWGLAALWGLALIASQVIVGAAASSVEDEPVVAMTLAMGVVVGNVALWLVPAIFGNRWRDANLVKRGYEIVATVDAETADAAVARAGTGSNESRSYI